MNKKRVAAITIGLVAVLLVTLFLNSYSPLTGNAVEGGECFVQGEDDCQGEDVLICINEKWENFGKVPGQCGYQDDSGSMSECMSNDDCYGDETCRNGFCVADDGNSSTLMWSIVIILVILILGVIGFIIYLIIKKDNSKRNNTPGKMFTKKPPIKPMGKPSVKPLMKPTNPISKPAPIKPSITKTLPINPVVSPAIKPSIKLKR